jgi:hypothetical protein
MNKINISGIVFSLALIAALAFAVVPMSPAHALSNSAVDTVMTNANHVETTILAPNTGVVCKSVVVWRNGHRIVLRVCHKIEKPS